MDINIDSITKLVDAFNQKACNDLKTRVTNLKNDHLLAETALSLSQSDLASNARELPAAEATLAETREKIGPLDTAIAEKEHQEQQQKLLAEKKLELEAGQREVANLELHIQQFVDPIRALDTRIAELQSEVSSLESQIEAAKPKSEAASSASSSNLLVALRNTALAAKGGATSALSTIASAVNDKAKELTTAIDGATNGSAAAARARNQISPELRLPSVRQSLENNKAQRESLIAERDVVSGKKIAQEKINADAQLSIDTINTQIYDIQRETNKEFKVERKIKGQLKRQATNSNLGVSKAGLQARLAAQRALEAQQLARVTELQTAKTKIEADIAEHTETFRRCGEQLKALASVNYQVNSAELRELCHTINQLLANESFVKKHHRVRLQFLTTLKKSIETLFSDPSQPVETVHAKWVEISARKSDFDERAALVDDVFLIDEGLSTEQNRYLLIVNFKSRIDAVAFDSRDTNFRAAVATRKNAVGNFERFKIFDEKSKAILNLSLDTYGTETRAFVEKTQTDLHKLYMSYASIRSILENPANFVESFDNDLLDYEKLVSVVSRISKLNPTTTHPELPERNNAWAQLIRLAESTIDPVIPEENSRHYNQFNSQLRFHTEVLALLGDVAKHFLEARRSYRDSAKKVLHLKNAPNNTALNDLILLINPVYRELASIMIHQSLYPLAVQTELFNCLNTIRTKCGLPTDERLANKEGEVLPLNSLKNLVRESCDVFTEAITKFATLSTQMTAIGQGNQNPRLNAVYRNRENLLRLLPARFQDYLLNGNPLHRARQDDLSSYIGLFNLLEKIAIAFSDSELRYANHCEYKIGCGKLTLQIRRVIKAINDMYLALSADGPLSSRQLLLQINSNISSIYSDISDTYVQQQNKFFQIADKQALVTMNESIDTLFSSSSLTADERTRLPRLAQIWQRNINPDAQIPVAAASASSAPPRFTGLD